MARQIKGPERVELGKKLRAEYEDGATVRELAGALGRSYSFVYNVLIESGVEFRARGIRRTLPDTTP